MDAEQSTMYGFDRFDFILPESKRSAFVTLSSDKKRRNDSAWIWYAPTFINSTTYSGDTGYKLPKSLHEYYLGAALNAGVSLGGVDVGESWGAPYGREIFSEFYSFVIENFSLNKKVCMMPQSRGGLMCYNWAAENPECVKAIGAIYPVCDVTRAERLADISKAYEMPAEKVLNEKHLHNPIDRVEPLVTAGVIIQHIHGQVDDVVPFDSNSKALVDNYKKLGGTAALIPVPDKGHEEVNEFFKNEAMREFFVDAGGSLTI